MNERQRQDYLEAMGIQPWFPRFVLPGAKVSATCEWDYQDSPVPATTHAISTHTPPVCETSLPAQPQQPVLSTPRPASPQPSAGQLRESSNILDELGFANQEESEDASTERSSKTEAASSETVLAEPFRLAVIDISETCLAISDLPWSGLNQFTSYHQRLLANIIRALKLPSDQEWSQGMFAWPIIPDEPAIDRKYAKEAVYGYLNNQFGLKRRKTLLLFGQASCSYLWCHDASFEDCRGIQERDNIRYGITCSLGEMMGIPELKAEAWANLKPLINPSS